MAKVSRHLEVRGRVQGVGYRAFVQSEALELGLAGWARNRRNGRVEILAVGEPETIERLIARLRVGPSGARVEAIAIGDAPPGAPAPVGSAFEILPTV